MTKTSTYAASIGLATVAALAAAYLYLKKKKELIPWSWEEIGTVKEIDLYPLKSGHNIELSKADCTEVGLKQTKDDEKAFQMRDRCLIVYAEKDKEFRTARTYPKMVLIDVAVHDEDHLAVDAPTMRTLYVKVPKKNSKNETIVKFHHGEEVHAIDCGDEAALWFSRYILEKDSGLRLGYHDGSHKRDIRSSYKTIMDYYKNLTNASTGLYSDLSSVLLLSQASVADLNKRIGNTSVTTKNFRPNIVVEGPNLEPYDEDEWEWVRIKNVVFRNVKECTRCVMTTVNPENGMRMPDREPLQTLKKYRMSDGPDKEPVMGINMEVRKTGTIAVGDPVYVFRKSKK